MTENNASVRLEVIRAGLLSGTDAKIVSSEENIKAITVIINALEEIQQYRKHGITIKMALNNMCDLTAAENLLEEYRAIGTPEECRAAVDKRTVKKPIRMDKCTCPSCGTHNEVWKKRRNTLPSDIVYCWHCGQAVEIFRRDEE